MQKKAIDVGQLLWMQTAEEQDLLSLGRLRAARLLFDVLLINTFEHALLSLKNDDCVWGPVHTSVGQEATAAGVIQALRKTDKAAGTHRSHHHFLSKVMHYVLPEEWNPADSALPDIGEEAVYRTLAEIMGLKPGYCGGRGGSMHLRCPEAGFLGSNAIVAGGIPLATGAAFAEKHKKTGNLVVSYFSDGAMNQGAFHEACNFAAVWKLPVIFFIENNFYSVATHTDAVCAVTDLVQRAVSYNVEGYSVDGSDLVALYKTTEMVAERVRNGGGPCFIEARCYRRYHHAGDQPGSAFKYRDKDEETAWANKEVTVRFPKQLVEAKLLAEAEVARLQKMAADSVARAVEQCTLPGKPRKVKSDLWPPAESLGEGIRSGGDELAGITYKERDDFDSFTEMKYSDAIAAATGRWLEKDPDAFVLGEEVANFGGGAYGATKNLPTLYPDRCLNAPISEAGIVGLGLGAAMSGMRAVAEIMFPDFSLVAADQLFNQVAKARHMYGNTTEVQLVVRTRIATGCGYGGQHSMDPIGLYALFPGFRIVAPSNSFDYIGLFNTAMQSHDPVLMLEHHMLYGQKFPVPENDLDYFVPFGKARVLAAGSDVTVITYSSLVGRCEALLERWNDGGVSAELVDLRTVDPWSIDYDAIGASVKKTGAAVVVEQAAASHAIGAHIAAEITERFFDFLDGPVARATSANVPNPVSRALEQAAMISDEQIHELVCAVAKRRWR